MTYAVPLGRWLSRNCAVARALVQIASSGTSIPERCSRAFRSRGVKIELLVSSRKGRPIRDSRWTNSAAPGIGSSSWTSTPSMSDSQARTARLGAGERVVMRPCCHGRPRCLIVLGSRCAQARILGAMSALPSPVPADRAAAGVWTAFEHLAGRPFVALTGAGMSTDSGIPDYRGPGAPSRMPMTYSEFVSGPEAQQRYWGRSHLGWARMRRAVPNDGHRALAALEAMGRVRLLITQNVDGLHEAAGSRA